MADEAVYLHGLRVENFLRCELVEIAIDGPGLTLITGENAQGKSSVLKAIIAALGGTKVLPDRPVREGAAQADVELDLGDKLVHLRVKPDRTATLTVTAKDGSSVYKSPQRLLDALRIAPLRLPREAEPWREVRAGVTLLARVSVRARELQAADQGPQSWNLQGSR